MDVLQNNSFEEISNCVISLVFWSISLLKIDLLGIMLAKLKGTQYVIQTEITQAFAS